MMNRTFTTRETIFLLVCSMMFLTIFYYQVVWKSTGEAIKAYDTIELEDELLVIQTKAQKMMQMEKKIEENKGNTTGLVADYNNLDNEIIELNRVLKKAKTYQLQFEDPTTDGNIVRRNFTITFEAQSYETGKYILEQLQKSRYQCLLRDITFSAMNDSIQHTKKVNVSVKGTFYEGVTENAIEAGLEKYQDGSTTTK